MNRLKKTLAALLTLALAISLALPAAASDGYGEDTYYRFVYDYSGMLSDDEAEDIESRLKEVSEENSFWAVFHTSHDLETDIVTYCESFIDSHFGYTENTDCILLCVDTEQRQLQVYICGSLMYEFSDGDIDLIYESVVSELSDDSYYSAALIFSSLTKRLIAENREQDSDGIYRQDEDYEVIYSGEMETDLLGGIPGRMAIAAIFGLIVSAILRAYFKSELKSVGGQSGAAGYLKDGSFNLRDQRDIFLYRRLSKTARPKESSSGRGLGGTTIHRSPSGRSYSGRGGRF